MYSNLGIILNIISNISVIQIYLFFLFIYLFICAYIAWLFLPPASCPLPLPWNTLFPGRTCSSLWCLNFHTHTHHVVIACIHNFCIPCPSLVPQKYQINNKNFWFLVHHISNGNFQQEMCCTISRFRFFLICNINSILLNRYLKT
jgi:hypothetical protein